MRRALASALRAVASLSGVWFLLQALPRWLPEDPARIAAGEWASESEVAAMRHLLLATESMRSGDSVPG